MIKVKGGKVVASGGFGCIFEPALKCEGENKISNNENMLSKLMINANAKDEYANIEKYNSKLSVIPNYTKYFLLNNFYLCKPDKLTKDDLNNYKKKCKALKKKGIKVTNINKSLDDIMSINMPNGGIDVEKFVDNNFSNTSNMIMLNNSLIELLIKGIVPMNDLNVYHCDIKDTNVLVKVTNKECLTRLIDWGLSVTIDKENKGIPRKLYRRPFQYNVPFSSIIFNKEFISLYIKFLELNPIPDYFKIREFVINYIFIWNDIRGAGHLSAINNIMKKLTIKDLTAIKKDKIKEHFIEYDFTYYYIVEYLSKILEKYTTNGELDLMMYFEQIFLKNIDIWGFIMIYTAFYDKLYKEDATEIYVKIMSKIKYIIIRFLYENPINVIDVSALVTELQKLNEIIELKSVGGFMKINKMKKTKKMKQKNKKKGTRKII